MSRPRPAYLAELPRDRCRLAGPAGRRSAMSRVTNRPPARSGAGYRPDDAGEAGEVEGDSLLKDPGETRT